MVNRPPSFPLLTLVLTFLTLAYSQSVFEVPQQIVSAANERRGCTRSIYPTFDGSCNSLNGWGAANQAQLRTVPISPSKPSLPSARLVSNVVLDQSYSDLNDRRMSELVTFFGQLLDHTFVSTPTTNERFDIEIPKDDSVFKTKNGKLKFSRSQKQNGNPINKLSSFVDASSVYGNSESRARALRTLRDGKMKMERDLLPKNRNGLENAPGNAGKREVEFYVAGDDRANEHPVLVALHTIFVREHNLICDELARVFPEMAPGDEQLFQMARKINIAQFQKIVFKEFLPTMLGSNPLPPYRGYRPGVRPDISLTFSTAAFRVGHTMVNDKLTLRGPRNRYIRAVKLRDAFFNPGLIETYGVEPFLRGTIKSRAQEIDTRVVEGLRNFLFSSVEKEFPAVAGFDLASLNIQRGRDHALGSYIAERRKLGLSEPRRFEDITRTSRVVRALQKAYAKDIKKVEPWVAGLAEDHKSGSSLGPFFHAAWVDQFTRLRDGDYFYYERDGQFPPEMRRRVPRVRALFSKEPCMRAILLRTTSITESELPADPWFV